MEFAIPRLGLAQARRLLLLQGRLRSNEPTQILVCAAFGGLIGATTIGLHRLVDLAHTLIFNISGEHALSSGLGVDLNRVLFVPALGGLILGISVMIMRRVRPTDVVDPIEANALHGGRMSMTDSLRLLVATIWSNASGVAVGMEAGYSQLGAAILAKVGQYFRLRREDQRIFVAAGAGAAIGAIVSRHTGVVLLLQPTTFMKVDFPDPDGPMIATNSPSCTSSDTPLSAWV